PQETQAESAQGAIETIKIPVRDLPEEQEGGSTTHARPSVYPTEEGAVWHALVQELAAQEKISALARELALQSQLVARDGDHWHWRVENASLNQASTRGRLCTALQEAGVAQAISVEVGPVSDSPARRNAQKAAEQ